MTTQPGFSSRSQSTSVQQFPMRDEAAMTVDPGFSNSEAVKTAPADVFPEVGDTSGLNEGGWSNSAAVKDAPQDTVPEVVDPSPALKPGASNVTEKVVSPASTEDKAVRRTAKKSSK